MKRGRIDPKYVDINLTRTIIIFAIVMLYCIYLGFDNFHEGSEKIGLLATFCAGMTAIALIFLSICRFGNRPRRILMHVAIILQCIVFWFTFGEFLYTGGTGGTSIFLIFASAPVAFFFFNLFYGSLFSGVLLVGMVIYMSTPLRFLGYQFPEMYYKRLPIMYLVEVVMCAVAQYETDKAKIKQDIALEEARKASEAKTDFLANTSHEIRTPINAVLGMNEMILKESARSLKFSDDPEGCRKGFEKIANYADNINSAGNNLLGIINDILDFTKIEEGRMDIIDVEYKFSSVLNDVCNMIDFRAKAKSIMFATDIDRSLPDSLCGDEVRVRQIISNLLTNAVKYTDEGSVILKVRKDGSYTDPDNNGTIRLVVSVKDTGRGIKEEDMGRLFDKFERIDMEKNSTIEGTGLGLAITRRLLDMMGGDIRVQSEYGTGSTFTVSFLQKELPGEPIGNYKERYREHQIETARYKEIFVAPDARILVVDDTRMNLVVAKEFLKDTRVQTDTARNGMEAVEKAARAKYDVIFMDQRMPMMDGVEALHNIRKDPEGLNKDTPVICLTADAVIGARERYLSQGFNDYLTKPIDSGSLERMLKKYLSEDKISIVRSEEKGKGTATDLSVIMDITDAVANYKALEEVGVDVVKGLYNCSNDGGFYGSVLNEYSAAYTENKRELEEYIEKEDFGSYGIRIHGVKSTSATIGAMDLSALAADLERAAKGGDYEYVKTNHIEAMEEYDRIVRKIHQTVNEDVGSEYIVEEENGVMEFAPKNE